MRRQLVCRRTWRSTCAIGLALGRLFAQLPHVALQEGDFLLLAHDDGVELVQQVLAEAGFDFQLGEALVNGVWDRLGGVQGGIGHDVHKVGATSSGASSHRTQRWRRISRNTKR